MKDRQLVIALMSLTLSAIVASAAEAPSFAGEYADRKFLSGQAVFQMSLEQSGNTVTVWFSTAYNDGHGCGPEANGTGKTTGKGTVEFSFRDSSRNAGTGIITRTGDDIVVSLKTTRLADSQCLELYRQNIRLKRVAKN